MTEGSARSLERRRMGLLTIAATALIVVLAGFQLTTFLDSRAIRDRVDRSYERQVLLDRVLLLMQDIETGQRGFTLTGNPEFLQPYVRATGDIGEAFDRLERTGEGLSQVQALKSLGARKIAVSKAIIDMRRKGDPEGAEALVASGRGKAVMDAFREQVGAMRSSEAAALDQLLRSSARSNYSSVALAALLQLLLTGMLAAAFWAYRDNLKQLRRVSEEAKGMSERQIAIFEAASDGMMVIDRDARIESLNRAAVNLFGGKHSDMLGKRAQDLFEGEPIYIYGGNERRVADRPGTSTKLTEGLRQDGSRFVAEVSTSAVPFGDNICTLLIVRDATERSRMEAIKSQFVSTVSHELRTPLTSIRGALGLLDHSMGTELEAKPRQLLDIARTNSERLSTLIDDILDVEKLGARDLQFHFTRIDVRETVERAVENNRTFAADRGVRLNATVPDFPIIVHADESRLLQAFTNLLSNAAKFSPKDGLVSIFAEARDGFVRISVADQGSGIPVEFRPHLFDRFTQAGGGHQASTAGTGLGLAITKAIVERHKGRIGYESSVGEGTLFWVELPLAENSNEP